MAGISTSVRHVLPTEEASMRPVNSLHFHIRIYQACIRAPHATGEVADTRGASAPAYERFFTVVPARYDQVVRGVSFTPGSR